jgi:hypothetical protein
MPEPIGLKELIQGLRRELNQALMAPKPGEVRFELGDIELTLQLEVERSSGVDGGLSFSVLTLGAERGQRQATTHTIKLALKPRVNDKPIERLLDDGV